jgi:hypothetical protein
MKWKQDDLIDDTQPGIDKAVRIFKGRLKYGCFADDDIKGFTFLCDTVLSFSNFTLILCSQEHFKQ